MRIRPTIVRRDAYQHIFRVRFRVLNKDVKVAVIVEYACIEQFIFRLAIAAPLIFRAQLIVREGALGIFIQCLTVAMSGKSVQVIELLFDVFAVLAFGVPEAKEPLF